MATKLEYSTIGKDVVVRLPLELLSNRDKVSLLSDLLLESGIAERLSEADGKMVSLRMAEMWEGKFKGE